MRLQLERDRWARRGTVGPLRDRWRGTVGQGKADSKLLRTWAVWLGDPRLVMWSAPVACGLCGSLPLDPKCTAEVSRIAAYFTTAECLMAIFWSIVHAGEMDP